MLLLKQSLLLLLVVFVTADENSSNLKNNEHVSVILKYLNEQPSNYIYNEGRVIESTEKDDILEVDTDIDATCKGSPSEQPCTSGTLRCHSSVKKNPENSHMQVVNTSCVPKEDISEVDENAPTREENSNVEMEVTSESSRPVSIPCLGCPFDLNVDAEGVSTLVDTALRHVESERNVKHAMVRVLRLQQQVVAGIKYIMVIEIAPTTCPKDSTASPCPVDTSKGTYLCEVEYWEQPWLNSGKNIIRNNCTASQEYLAKQPENLPTESHPRDVDDDFLAELESQIIPESRFASESYFSYRNEIEEPSKKPDVMTPNFVLNQDIRPDNDLQESFTLQKEAGVGVTGEPNSENGNDERKPVVISRNERSDDSDSSTEEKKESDSDEKKSEIRSSKKSSESSKSSKSSESSESSENSENEDDERNHDGRRKKKTKSSSNSSESSESSKSSKNSDSSDSSDDDKRKEKDDKIPSVEIKRKRSTEFVDNISEDEKILLGKFAKKAATNLGWDNAKTSISQVIKVEMDGLYFSMRVKIEKASSVKVCTLLVHTSADLTSPELLKSTCFDKRVRRGIPGGIVEIEKDNPDVKKFLNDGLLHLDSYSPHTNRYKIKEILNVSSQVVAGRLLRVKARIIVSDCVKSTDGSADECGELEGAPSKVCDFKIWDRPWLKNGRETKIVCDNEDKTYSFRMRRDVGMRFI